jgi:hypothetical protein
MSLRKLAAMSCLASQQSPFRPLAVDRETKTRVIRTRKKGIVPVMISTVCHSEYGLALKLTPEIPI